ncbi:LysR family transcriptional regulator [Adlercreutzia sp. ZJ304]|uniref:LysR family transcriptional regulator n=1 Tax=Adlercreutzia sp. ZJ304 TaxID=2709791 RepID=UPI0013EC177B|nr:LysR family transcriptional regulator [Adlercreutzia sp. ZJ304]
MDHLRYFASLDDVRSFSEAAKLANISQQGYSRAMAALESEVGCKLVNRGRNGSHLTDKGKAFMRHAKLILAEYDAAMLELHDISTLANILSDYSGRIVFTNACMVSIGARLLDRGYLGNAEIIEIGLSDLGYFDSDPDCIVIADISPDIYPDFDSTHSFLPIASGRIGIVVHGRLLPEGAENPIWESLKTLPLGIFDCDASVEIYDELFKELKPESIRLKSANNNVLERSLSKGELALLCDSFSWRCFTDEIHRNAHIRFIPIKKIMHSVFGLVRSGELEITQSDIEFVSAYKTLLLSEDDINFP